MNFLKLFQRKQPDSAVPTSPQIRDLKKLSKEVGNDLYKYAVGKISNVPNDMRKAAKAARLSDSDHSYLFWLLVNPPHWNSMPKVRAEALRKVLFVLQKTNGIPDYSSNFQMPEVEAEVKVEAVLSATAKWAANDLHRDLLKKTFELIKKKAKANGVSEAALEAMFLVSVKRDPRLFKYPDFLYWVVSSFVV